jgi:hypothetical protein
METSLDQAQPQPSRAGADINELADDLKQQASGITEQAKAKAKEAAHSGQAVAADQLQHLAQGVRRSAENFDDEQAWVRQGLSTAAESLERFSSTLRERDLGDLMREAETVARRHPVAFSAVCAFAGFALMRFLKSSSRDPSGYRDPTADAYRGRRDGWSPTDDRTHHPGSRRGGTYADTM